MVKQSDVALVPMAEKPITAEVAEKLRPTALHLFSDGNDYFIAETADEARALRDEYFGTAECTCEFAQVDDAKHLSSYVDRLGQLTDGPGPGIRSMKRSAREWCAEGKGYLFSEDV